MGNTKSRKSINDYIGKNYNDEIKEEIERVFTPYKIYICDIDKFYLEYYVVDRIRCVIQDGKIFKLKFN